MIKTFEDGAKLITGIDFDNWAESVSKLPKGKKAGCVECKHAEHEDYCSEVDCSHLWQRSCSCHINPPCPVCLNNYFEKKDGVL